MVIQLVSAKKYFFAVKEIYLDVFVIIIINIRNGEGRRHKRYFEIILALVTYLADCGDLPADIVSPSHTSKYESLVVNGL